MFRFSFQFSFLCHSFIFFSLLLRPICWFGRSSDSKINIPSYTLVCACVRACVRACVCVCVFANTRKSSKECCSLVAYIISTVPLFSYNYLYNVVNPVVLYYALSADVKCIWFISILLHYICLYKYGRLSLILALYFVCLLVHTWLPHWEILPLSIWLSRGLFPCGKPT